jgi:hypothetical protein
MKYKGLHNDLLNNLSNCHHLASPLLATYKIQYLDNIYR